CSQGQRPRLQQLHSYFTGCSNMASPRFVSAKAHQIWTFAMSGTYFGTVILRFILPPLIDNFCSKYAFPFESTTCQCGSGASGALNSSDRVKTLLPFSVVWVTNPVLAFAP